MKSIIVGEVEITALTDIEGAFFRLSSVFPGIEAGRWEPYFQRYPWAFADPSTLYGRVGAYLLRSPGQVLLVDTGIGPGAMGMHGRLPRELEEAGVQPEAVDTVFLTHLHGDHAGWSLTADGGPRFPNARYLTQADELESAEPYLRRAMAALEEDGVLELMEGEEAFGDEFTAVPTPGHSPGHASLLVDSGGQRALVTGDVLVHPAQVDEPGWNIAFDVDKARAAFTRHMLLDWAEADALILAAGHVPGAGFGQVRRGDDGRRHWHSMEEDTPASRGPGHGTQRSAR